LRRVHRNDAHHDGIGAPLFEYICETVLPPRR
jgi:hypothetical protein